MKIDGVFSGGGVKAYAFLGALQSVEENELTIERVAGTSAGAIVAALLAAKYQTKEINDLIQDLDLKSYLDPPKITKIIPFSKWLFLYFQLGIYKGDKLEKWLSEKLSTKNVYTFNDLKPGYLKVIVSDLSLGKLVVIPDDLDRIYGIDPTQFSVARAVRMSAGFPYFFMPKKLSGNANGKSIIVDGGLLSNFPLWVFENRDESKKRPILGVRLSSEMGNHQPRKINNALDMFHSLFLTMMEAHDARYISKSHANNIIFIPVEKVESINFSINDKTKQRLIELGRKSSDQFLKYWPT